jgi:hypothetical protein
LVAVLNIGYYTTVAKYELVDVVGVSQTSVLVIGAAGLIRYGVGRLAKTKGKAAALSNGKR